MKKSRRYFNYFLLILTIGLYVGSIVIFLVGDPAFALTFFAFACAVTVITYFMISYQKRLTEQEEELRRQLGDHEPPTDASDSN